MKVEIDIEFEIGEKVEFNDKRGMDSGIVTGYTIRQNNCISYCVVWSDKKDDWHYGFELKKLTNGKN